MTSRTGKGTVQIMQTPLGEKISELYKSNMDENHYAQLVAYMRSPASMEAWKRTAGKPAGQIHMFHVPEPHGHWFLHITSADFAKLREGLLEDDDSGITEGVGA